MSDADDLEPESNPYAAPKSLNPGADDGWPEFQGTDPAKLRLAYLDREGTVKLIGLFYIIGGVLGAVNIGIQLANGKFQAAMAAANPQAANAPPGFTQTIVFVSAGATLVFGLLFGLGLRLLATWARWVVIILGGIGIVFGAFGVLGTLALTGARLDTLIAIPGFFLAAYYVIFLASSQTGAVFSDEYRRAVAATPEIHPTLGTRDKILLAIFAVMSLLGIATSFIK